MADILDFDQMLEKLRALEPLRRVLLASTGTLQGALSAYFGEPVDVRVLSQDERAPDGAIERAVELVCRGRGAVACRAHTRIDAGNDVVRKLVLEGQLGLGQICESLGLRTTFTLDAVGQDARHFWREYRLEGDGFCYRIREEFDNALYEAGSSAGVAR